MGRDAWRSTRRERLTQGERRYGFGVLVVDVHLGDEPRPDERELLDPVVDV